MDTGSMSGLKRGSWNVIMRNQEAIHFGRMNGKTYIFKTRENSKY